MRGLKLSEPRPAPPFVGYSLAAMKNAFSKVRWPIFSRPMHYNHLPGCDMGRYIECLFHVYYDGVDGLNLGAFVDMSKKT
ncbi:hypothetical protein M441DRAFT_52965 [Trichoderma asperellum CBS 433.97]|uniref:Uncharacterized protein n=1 Tax=Trichoderma asperellum (strain ATCC 204424 / CBS 433.97 / NBRC 101777) TaxID=1042311 RepID=A0A2T3ZN37_TRIA4|nr:hypothetical protein M441DRAFT_52965 [Trichoderma asperellum CBS 433.97]PTB46206.1 hypothetical protein M441DRAFT_52965 [Trichoderma asperellum CBS 433.97]